jgi:hypothetical protein
MYKLLFPNLGFLAAEASMFKSRDKIESIFFPGNVDCSLSADRTYIYSLPLFFVIALFFYLLLFVCATVL